MTMLPSNTFRNGDALFFGFVRKHRPTHDVAHGPNVRQIGFAIGINQTFLSSGALAPINVCMHGISKAISAASITAGDKLVASGLGLVTPATTTNGTGTGGATSTAGFYQIIGWALQTAVTSGAEILIYVNPQIIR